MRDFGVSIPSSSGQWFHPISLFLNVWQGGKFQSLLHQVSGSIVPPEVPTPADLLRFNPFFIRSVVPSVPLPMARELARSVSIPSSSGQWFHQNTRISLPAASCQFQSLLHQVSGSIAQKVGGPHPDPEVSIPSSSGQWFHLRNEVRRDQRRGRFQSLLHQVSGSIGAYRARVGGGGKSFNPFFIRSVVPSNVRSSHRS